MNNNNSQTKSNNNMENTERSGYIEAIKSLIKNWNVSSTEVFGQSNEYVTEKSEPYTILEFKEVNELYPGRGKWIYTLQPDGIYWSNSSNDMKVSKESMLNGGFSVQSGNWIIQKIRRNSDNETFQIGDWIQHKIVGDIVQIDNIQYHGTSAYLNQKGASVQQNNINNVIKVPAPVQEPIWQVEAYKEDTEATVIRYRTSNGKFAFGKNGIELNENICKQTGDKIWSVKRLTDGLIVTVGDKITAPATHTGNKPMEVLEIVTNDRGNCLLKTREFDIHGVGIENVQKPKLLCVTEDGVEVYDLDIPVWLISPYGTVQKGSDNLSKCSEWVWNGKCKWKIFSTEKARSEYIDSKSPKWVPEVGEWVYIVKNCSSSNNKPDTVAKVVEVRECCVDRDPATGKYIEEMNCELEGLDKWEPVRYLRKATQEEIDSVKPKILLTTQDGIEVTDPEQMLYGVSDAWIRYGQSAKGVLSNPVTKDNVKWFSTQELRDEYILNNKPLFSIQDLHELELQSGYCKNKTSIWLDKYKVIAKAKEKLNA